MEKQEFRITLLEEAVEWLFLEMMWMLEEDPIATPEERKARLGRVLREWQKERRTEPKATVSISGNGKDGPEDVKGLPSGGL